MQPGPPKPIPHLASRTALMSRRPAARLACALLAALTLAGAPSARASSTPNLPDWMLQAVTSAPPGGGWGNAKAVILLHDVLLTVQPDGRAVERTRMVVKILRQQGREYAIPHARYTKDEKLQAFHVWSIAPDGHRYAMKDSDYIEVGEDDPAMVYLDGLYKIARPPGADPGAIVAWEDAEQFPSYEIEDFWQFQESIPVVQANFEIDLPPGWHQRAVWFHHDAVEPSQPGPGQFRWQLTNIRAVDLEGVPLHPAWEALAGRMSVHFSASDIPDGDALWAKIGQWYTTLESPQSEGGSDIAAAARAAAGNGDFMARLDNIADFMQQQIRYVGVEIGIGGRQAHPAEQIFHNRYGDCKDKATLMIAMLDAAGIRATWVAVDDRRGVIDPHAPSDFGNHMIVAIEIPKGYDHPRLQAVVNAATGKRYLIFDPTNPYVPVGQLPEYEQGGYGLLFAGADSQILAFPVLSPDLARTRRTAAFELASDGTLRGAVTVERSGTAAWTMRDRLARATDKETRDSIVKALQQDLPVFTLDSEKTANLRALSLPLTLEYSLTAPQYARTAGALLLVRPRVLGSVAEPLDDKPRHVPISFDGVGEWIDSFDVRLPAGYAVDDLPDPVNLDVGFATYHSEVKAQGDTLHYSRQFVLKKVELDPQQYSVLYKLEGEITSDENSNAVLKKQ